MSDKTKIFAVLSSLSCNDMKREVPSVVKIKELLYEMRRLMLPDFCQPSTKKYRDGQKSAEKIIRLLNEQIKACLCFDGKNENTNTEELSYSIFAELPKIKQMLISDANAIYEGDPAARSPDEVMLTYPGFYAISVYRIAHEIYIRKIPFMARIMTEIAHSKTGIDIHAGATIGKSFCIDHGTGVVIGETATIGNNVRIYQGVTIGAKSFKLSDDGALIKGGKRHPDIGNNCIVYAGATILGGDTVIGDGCVIGGNVWLTHSVPPGQTVYYEGK